ncbi:isopentenyl-diphosphate delta-isomerase [Actinocorallia herbida]|uniref:Isopentenyl-diphosphate delta-isomerase n=1 Tax=Actinocorallia herbida TaxID=58109 RepID=A0A3N1D5A0_9ACTN|nr:NUDIX domain-containing protein [Actinocorallia herbida]ROO88704.1 isopentenyl-diphosphate delta-isomerase [Actinocorallia herbida]
MTHPHDTEILDLVDGRDTVIRQIARSDFPRWEGRGHLRVVDCFLRNDRGELWIPRRALDKRLAPGGLDYSVGEHVLSGEDYPAAAVRGFAEELNLTVTPADLTYLAKIPPAPGKPFFQALYLLATDTAPRYNPADFTGFTWLTPEDLLTRIERGDPAKPSLAATVRHLLHLTRP